MKTTASHVRADETDPLWVLGDQLRFLGSVADRDLHVIDVRVPPGSGTPPHRHKSIEIFQVTEGEITFGVFDDGLPRMIVGRPGSVVTLPANLGHNYQNNSSAPASMTVVVEGQMREFFEEVGTHSAPPPGPPSADAIGRILAACQRHGIEVMGPPQ
ncbi:MAG TPA: cupin domain-containing protein [Lacunisphaera sp.]